MKNVKDITSKLAPVGIFLAGLAVGGALVYSDTKPVVLVKQDVNNDGRMDYVVNGSSIFIDNGQEEYQPIPSSDLAKKLNRLPEDYETFRAEYNFEE